MHTRVLLKVYDLKTSNHIFCKMSHLLAGCCRFLDISFNRLKVLPGSMSSLTGLAALNLAYNPLGSFPQVLCSLTNLRELNMDQTGVNTEHIISWYCCYDI
jgi:hypothetical protein